MSGNVCPRCRRPVRYLAAEHGGRRLIVDPEPVRAGDVLLLDAEHGVARRLRREFSRAPEAFTGDLLVDVPVEAPRYRSHAQTCEARR